MTALDVGANRGVTSLTLAKAVGEDGRVWAFEPIPEYFAALRESLHRNHVTNVQAHRLTIIDKTREIEFYKHGGGSGVVPLKAAQRLIVTATTIDEFLGKRPIKWVDLLSADYEGSELLMLRGGEKTLRAYCPQIFCEVHHSYLDKLGHSIGELVEYLHQLHYEVQPVSVEQPDDKPGFDECSHIYASLW